MNVDMTLVELNRYRGNWSILGNFRMLILKFTIMKKRISFSREAYQRNGASELQSAIDPLL
jgi:hypothetical protein